MYKSFFFLFFYPQRIQIDFFMLNNVKKKQKRILFIIVLINFLLRIHVKNKSKLIGDYLLTVLFNLMF